MQKVILFKKEAVYATDAAPTTGANACLTRNFQAPNPIQNDQLDRNLDLPTIGRRKSAPTNERTAFSYELELAGSGDVDAAPGWMEHLEACRMAAPVITADTKVEQKFAAEIAAMSSATAWHWLGEQRTRAVGCRGSFGINFTAGAYPFLTLNMMGLLGAAPDAVAPVGAPDFTRWKDPLEVNTANTDFLLDGYAAILQSYALETNAELKLRNLVGANYIQRGDHAAVARIRIEAPTIAAKNYFTGLRSGAEIAHQIVHGTVAGNIVQLDAAYSQILSIDRSVEDDKIMFDLQVGLNISAGSDDLLLTSK